MCYMSYMQLNQTQDKQQLDKDSYSNTIAK